VAGNTTHKNITVSKQKIIGRAIHNHCAIYYAKNLAIITAFNSIYKVTLSPL